MNFGGHVIFPPSSIWIHSLSSDFSLTSQAAELRPQNFQPAERNGCINTCSSKTQLHPGNSWLVFCHLTYINSSFQGNRQGMLRFKTTGFPR